jgi:class 3 adenylate cyclase
MTELPPDAELALVRGGLRFKLAATEAEYAQWHIRTSQSSIRVACVVAIAGFLGGLGLIWWASPSHRMQAAEWILLLALPVALIAFGLTFSPRLQRLAMYANILAAIEGGLTCVGLSFWVLKMPAVSMGAVVMVCSFPLIYRFRPMHAVLTIAPWLALHEYLVLQAKQAGDVEANAALTYVLLPLLAAAITLTACVMFEMASRRSFCQERIIAAQQQVIAQERRRADELLFSILPEPIAQRLKRSKEVIANRFEDVTVLFADVVGFTPLSMELGPEKLVELLNALFTRFDLLAEQYGVEKIKTIGDAYMAVAGLPTPRPDHAEAVARMALEMRDVVREISTQRGYAIQIRIGMASGPVVAGVIGARKFAYDLWGDTVNTAARMESHGVPGEIQVAETTFHRLRDKHSFQERGVLDIKGKGAMRTWMLNA